MNLHAGALPQLSSPASHCPTLAPAPAPGGRYASQKPLRPPCTRWPAAADASWSSSPPLQHTAAAVAGRSPVGHISPSHVRPLMGVGRGSYVISLRLSGESAPCPSHRRVFDSPLQACCTQVALRKHRRGFISLPTHAPLLCEWGRRQGLGLSHPLCHLVCRAQRGGLVPRPLLSGASRRAG